MGKTAEFKRLLTWTFKPTAAVARTRFCDLAGNQIAVAATASRAISQETLDATDVANGVRGTYTLAGVEELEIGAPVNAAGLEIASDATGKGVVAVATNKVNALSLSTGAADGDRISVLMVDPYTK
jgi:hypothetical protein